MSNFQVNNGYAHYNNNLTTQLLNHLTRSEIVISIIFLSEIYKLKKQLSVHILTTLISRLQSPFLGPEFIIVMFETIPEPLNMAMGEKN